MTGAQNFKTQLIHAGVAVVVIVCATVLGYGNHIGMTTVVTIYAVALTFAGGAALSSNIIGQLTNGSAILPPDAVSQREQTIRSVVDKLGDSAPATPPEDH